MRRSIGLVLVGLGVLMVVLAPMSRWYAYPRLAVVSNDVAERVSTGADVTVLDLGAVVRQDAEVERVTDVRSVRRIIPDQGDSTGDTAVWDTSVTTFDELGSGATPEENVLSYFEERVAFERHSAEAVDGHHQYYTPTGERADRVEVDHAGYYFKLPFGTEQRSYPFWDSTIQDTRPMEFQSEATIEGLPVYVFQQIIEPTPVSALEIPGALFGQAGSIVADRIYSNTRTIWVEPHTGAIIKGQEEQDSYLDFEGTRGPTIVQGTLAYTDDQVSANVDEFSSSADRLELVRDTVPVAAAAGGLAFVILGLLLARRGAYAGKRRAPVADDAGGPGGPGSGGPGGSVAAEPRLHSETASGTGSAAQADQFAPAAEYAEPEPADYLARAGQNPEEQPLDERTPGPLPRRRPQPSAVRPPVGRPHVQAPSTPSLLGQSPAGQALTSPLAPDQPPAGHTGRSQDDRLPAVQPSGGSAESPQLEQTRADLARLEQARAELDRFAQEHPDLAGSDRPAAETPAPASPDPEPASAEPRSAGSEPLTAAAPAQGRRRARDDDGLFDEFDDDGQSAGSLHRY
ncbi:DUF3068 domain-containing protein [Jiangella aurantiaca]|uniref:DUF3068 domain-containing protein n=1 Tax=Jiangella aurantiaca TaxID=2530373 RepID=A0A4R5AN75_9ACTN|nr:DUF3068 domain-containing protein [Jiangella aurantiaca]TDD71702.1 DUF3068 domain-containing protein [Jiangella aurantiaca]